MPIRIAVVAALVLAVASRIPCQEKVRLTAEDGQPLGGAYHAAVGQPKGGVVLLHMEGGNRGAFDPIAGRLAARGFHVLALDLRGHGESALGSDGGRIEIGGGAANEADPAKNPFLKMHLDARAGLAFLRSKGVAPGMNALLGADLGACVALHGAAQATGEVGALILMTPRHACHGIDALGCAGRIDDRPTLILAAEEEAALGAESIRAALKGTRGELRLYPQKAVHGTRMFGRVPTVEADIIEWLEKSLAATLTLRVPLVKDLIVDGQVDPSEGTSATRLEIPGADGGKTEVRVGRNRTKLLFSFVMPERHLRQNEVVIYLDSTGAGPAAPDASCWRISFNPNNPPKPQIQVSQGAEGTWKPVEPDGVQAYGQIASKESWSAEISLSCVRFGIPDASFAPRIAFSVRGQKKEVERFWPATPNVANAPKSWVPSRLE